MLAGAAPGKSRCPPTPIPVLCHGTGKVTATSIPQAMAHRELEMSHQCVVLAPSAAVMPQQVPTSPRSLSSSPNFKRTRTLLCLHWDHRRQLLPFLQALSKPQRRA